MGAMIIKRTDYGERRLADDRMTYRETVLKGTNDLNSEHWTCSYRICFFILTLYFYFERVNTIIERWIESSV